MTKSIHTMAPDCTSSNIRLEPDDHLMMAEPAAEVGSLSPDPVTIQRQVIRPTISTKEIISITMHSVGRGRFAAHLGDRMLCVSETPLLSAARVLQAAGIPAATRLEMIHEGSVIVAMRTTVGVAAGLRVSETGSMPRFVPWRPDQLPRNRRFACTVDELGGQTRLSGYLTTFEPQVGPGGAAATDAHDKAGWESFRRRSEAVNPRVVEHGPSQDGACSHAVPMRRSFYVGAGIGLV
jgi:hypothetical protein